MCIRRQGGKKKTDEEVAASQAALDHADLLEMMDTLEKNLKKINTTL